MHVEGQWNDMPTGEQPLKKKTMHYKTYPSGWCGNSLIEESITKSSRICKTKTLKNKTSLA